jgi:RNA polymerase sigma factor (TIGR02999 family)
MTKQHDATDLLIDWRGGSAEALERLVPLVYDELKRVARGQLRREHLGHSLQATALVHEVYLRLVNVDQMTVDGRAHFLALAVRPMRQILVDHARRKQASKRGGGAPVVSLDEATATVPRLGRAT